jgi:hypothetical protein
MIRKGEIALGGTITNGCYFAKVLKPIDLSMFSSFIGGRVQ